MRLGKTTSQVSAFSPCNITGFFRIHDLPWNPLRVGSTGAGCALDTGVTTRVTLRKTQTPGMVSTFNGQPLAREAVSNNVARRYVELDGRSWYAEISHESNLPPGCGYGTSGSGALSLSLALNEAMGLSLSMSQAAPIAHVCEVECKTGLGTVASVFSGGFTARTAPGAPEIGEVRKLNLPLSSRIVSAGFGPISTKTVLGDAQLKKAINTCGRALEEKFLRDDSQYNFMTLSRKLSNCIGLMSFRLRRVMNVLDLSGFACSMMMLGEMLFCLAPREDASRVEAVFRSCELNPIISTVARSGAHLI